MFLLSHIHSHKASKDRLKILIYFCERVIFMYLFIFYTFLDLCIYVFFRLHVQRFWFLLRGEISINYNNIIIIDIYWQYIGYTRVIKVPHDLMISTLLVDAPVWFLGVPPIFLLNYSFKCAAKKAESGRQQTTNNPCRIYSLKLYCFVFIIYTTKKKIGFSYCRKMKLKVPLHCTQLIPQMRKLHDS